MDESRSANRFCEGAASLTCVALCLSRTVRLSLSCCKLDLAGAVPAHENAPMQGYALVEYKTRDEAQAALEGLEGITFLDKEITATWAFVKPPRSRGYARRR